MQVTVTVSDEIIREAAFRNKSVVEYVEELIDRGKTVQTAPALNSAIDRIRKLHAKVKIEAEKA